MAESESDPAAVQRLRRRATQALRRHGPQTHSRVLLFLAVSLWAGVALLGYSALREGSVLQEHGRRAIEAGGGFCIGACLPGSILAGRQAGRVRLAGALIAAATFYALVPWSWVW